MSPDDRFLYPGEPYLDLPYNSSGLRMRWAKTHPETVNNLSIAWCRTSRCCDVLCREDIDLNALECPVTLIQSCLLALLVCGSLVSALDRFRFAQCPVIWISCLFAPVSLIAVQCPVVWLTCLFLKVVYTAVQIESNISSVDVILTDHKYPSYEFL